MRRTWSSRLAGHAVEQGCNGAQQIAFAGFQVGEVRGEPGVAPTSVLVEHGASMLGEPDDDLASVGLVGGAGDEAGILRGS